MADVGSFAVKLQALCVFILCVFGIAQAEPQSFVRIGTGATSGTYFVMGGALASAMSNPSGSRGCDQGGSCGVQGMIAVAQSTEGSRENIDLLESGKIESAIIQADLAHAAFSGLDLYQSKAQPSLRLLANLYPDSIHVVVRKSDAIFELSDLKGKKVSIGQGASGSEVIARLLLQAFGVELADIEIQNMSPGVASDALTTKDIDAFIIVGGWPLSAVTDAARQVPIRLLPVHGRIADDLSRRYPFLQATAIVGGTYAGINDITPTLSVAAFWVVSADLSIEKVYAMTKALWHPNNQGLLRNSHARGSSLSLGNAAISAGLPLHPGAEEYYREVGVLNFPQLPAPMKEIMP